MADCNFCGDKLPKGTGKMFVFTDGRTFHFCSSKCEKNLLKLRRKPIKTKWTKKAEEFKKENK